MTEKLDIRFSGCILGEVRFWEAGVVGFVWVRLALSVRWLTLGAGRLALDVEWLTLDAGRLALDVEWFALDAESLALDAEQKKTEKISLLHLLTRFI